MSIDSVDVRTLTTALLSIPTCQAGLTTFGLFLCKKISAHHTEILNY
jgi:hypothetical protein